MDVKPGYKQTEVGVIPEDWVVTPLESVTPPNGKNGIVDGPFGSNLKTIHYRTSGIPIITSGYVTDGKFRADKYIYVDRAKFLEEKRSSVQPGDIVMAKIGERCGASAILPETHETGILSGNALKITVDPLRHSTFYVWQVLWNLHSSGDMELLRTVGAQPAISMANLKKHKIPIPPTKAEQEAIAEALSDTDALIESLEQLLTKKRLLKQGAMQELPTGKKRLPGFEINPGYKQTEAGVIPEDWDLDYIENLAHITTGGRNTQDRIDDGQYPFFVRSQTAERINSYSYDGEAVLTAGDGVGTGKVFHYINGKFDVHQRVYRISDFNKRVNGYFFFLYFSSRFYNRIMQMTAKSSVDSVRREMIARMLIPLPPTKAEQTAIATTLSDMDAEITALEAKLSKARQLKQGMMQELLTGRIRLI